MHDVDDLLAEHDWEADSSDDPRPERVHLVRSHQFQCTSAVGVGEKEGCGGSGGIAGLERRSRSGAIVRDLKEGWRKEGRGKR